MKHIAAITALLALCAEPVLAAQPVTIYGQNGNPAVVNGSGAVGTNAADGAVVTLGAQADAAYTGSGSASVVAALKGIYTNSATGTGLTGSAVPSSGVYFGCRAANADPTAVTNGQLVGPECGLDGKQIVLPYAVKELAVRGSTGATSTNTQVSIIPAGAGSLKNYITSIECSNSGASTSILTFTDSATTILINPAGGGGSWTFPVPLATAAATAFQVTFGTASTNQYCSAQGFQGL